MDDQQFTAKDFTPVDDIIDIIDNKNTEAKEEDSSAEDKSKETTNDGGEETTSEKKDTAQDSDGEESQKGQSSTQEDESGTSKDDNQLDMKDFDVPDDSELVWEDKDGNVIPVSQLLDEYANDTKWKKSNTEKASELADQKKAFETTVNQLGTEGISKALKDDDFMDALDDWFGNEKDNPFRQTDKITEYTESEQKIAEEKASLEIEKEILSLKKDDSTLTDEVVNSLVDYAIENGVTLSVAHRISRAETTQKEFEELKSELKERNIELSGLKKNPKKSPAKTVTKGEGSTSEDYASPAKDWKEAEARVFKSLGLK